MRKAENIVPLVVGLAGPAALALAVSGCGSLAVGYDRDGNPDSINLRVADVAEPGAAKSLEQQAGTWADTALNIATSPGVLGILGLAGVGGGYAARARRARNEVDAERARQEQVRRDIDQAYYEGLNTQVIRPAEVPA